MTEHEQQTEPQGRRSPYAQRVHEYLVTQHATARASMEGVARALGLSVRSLRRRLSREGTSYNAVQNDALGDRAKQLIRHSDSTVQQIAFEMGFADAGSFHRAFKRWTGTTPHAYRLALPSAGA